MVKHEGEEDLNLKFIIDYFTPEEPDTSKTEFDFRIHGVELVNVHFKYKDYNAPETDFGVNYKDIDARNINLTLSDFKLIEGGVRVTILDLMAQEKSGVKIHGFQTDVEADPNGVRLDFVKLETDNSNLELDRLYFKTKSWQSWLHFEDSVKLNVDIWDSKVSLLDVSYFAPALKGLDQEVKLEGIVKGNVRKLKVKDFDLQTGQKTRISGEFKVPDYRNFYGSFIDIVFDEITTCVEDIESFPTYPFDSGEKIQIPSNLRKLGTINIQDGFVYGPVSGDGFILKANMYSGIGHILAERGLKINYDLRDSTFYYQGPVDPNKEKLGKYDLVLQNVDLGAITGNKVFGLMNGGLFIKGKGLNRKDMDIDISGKIEDLQFKGYSYSDLVIQKGKIAKNQFEGNISIVEENLDMVYKGTVDFGYSKGLNFELDVNRAMLTKLNIIPKDSSRMGTELCTKLYVKTTGTNFNNLKGTIALSNLNFRQDTLDVFLDTLSLYIGRSKKADSVILESDILNGNIIGKFDLGSIQTAMKDQFEKVFPEYFSKKIAKVKKDSKFSFDFKANNLQQVINLFNPNLEIANNTILKGKLSTADDNLEFLIDSKRLAYNDLIIDNILIENHGAPKQLDLDIEIGHIKATESLQFSDIKLISHAEGNFINSDLSFFIDKYPDNPGSLIWETQVLSEKEYILDFDVSKLPIRGQTWNIEDRGMIFITFDEYKFLKFVDKFEFSNISLSKGEHEIFMNGVLSSNPEDVLNYKIKNFELKDLDDFIGETIKFDGLLNATGEIRDIFTNFDLNAVATVDTFKINGELVGDLSFDQTWNNETQSFDINGGIERKFKQLANKIKTFDFNGKYYLYNKKDNLNLNLIFDKTDISFVNSFLPQEQISHVSGFLNGQLEMKGTLTEPLFVGTVDFQAGNAYIGMLGNDFGLNGEIESTEDGFLINHMYISDPEGNTGTVIGAIFHDNFKNWNFDATFNLVDNPFEYYTSGKNAGFPKPLEKFQIMNTEYKDGDTYYGIAYVQGYAEIFGYDQHFEIDADITTLAGTKINFPMYGSTDVSEDDFIVFTPKDSSAIIEEVVNKIEGVDLNIDFDITNETEANIIFDETTDDMIHAKGSGLINLNLNSLGDLSMTGKYTIDQGNYFLSMKNLIKKNFTLRRGGTIDWTGKPYDADLDVQAVYSVKASFSEAIPDITNSDNTSSKDNVECVLSLTNSLASPQMDIDIQSSSNNESAKAALSRIKSSEDELNRQFFSLLMLQKFQPIVGVQSSGTGGVYNALGDALTGQLNSILNSIDDNYNFNLNYNQDDVNKTQTYEVGMSTEVLNDRLVISGSFGLENYSGGTTTQNNFIGDIKVEYKLNKDGSFRVNAFNESNDTRIIQDKDLGQFTQGIGIHYEENFDTVDSLKFLQYFLDLFRKKENRRFLRNKPKSEDPRFRSVHEEADSKDPTFGNENEKDTTDIDSTKLEQDQIIIDLNDSNPELQESNQSPFRKEEILDLKTVLNEEKDD